MFNNHLMKVCLAAVFAIGLAACSSSSDQASAPEPTEPTEPAPEPTPEERIAELQGQINALRAELGLDPIDIDGLTGSVSDLQGQVDDLTQQIADRDKDIADAAAKAMTATGKAVYAVLDDMGDIGTSTAGDSVIATTAPIVAAVHGMPTGVSETNRATFVGGLSAGLEDVEATDPAFTSAQAGKPASLAANNGFSGTMLSWSSPTRADTMTVYTDIAGPSRALFSERYGSGTQSITSASGEPLEGPQTGVTGTAFDGRTGGLVEHAANAKSATTVAENDVVKLAGAYKGAAGSYTCTPGGSTCTSTVNTDGSITFGGTATGGWTFTANTGAMVSVPDSAYTTFGWWMRDDLTSSDLLDSVAVFFGRQGGADATSDDALTGTAKYEGGAAGKYAWRDRVADTAHGGHFTAKAELTATFTTGADGDMLSGSISDFRIGDDGMDPGWTVTLPETAITSTGAVARADTVMTTWAVGSSEGDAAGGWQAQLVNTGADRNDNLPTGVAGAFNAEFGQQGRMLGAFGAGITNPNPPKN